MSFTCNSTISNSHIPSQYFPLPKLFQVRYQFLFLFQAILIPQSPGITQTRQSYIAYPVLPRFSLRNPNKGFIFASPLPHASTSVHLVPSLGNLGNPFFNDTDTLTPTFSHYKIKFMSIIFTWHPYAKMNFNLYFTL